MGFLWQCKRIEKHDESLSTPKGYCQNLTDMVQQQTILRYMQ